MLKVVLHRENVLIGAFALTLLLFLSAVLYKFSGLSTYIIPAIGLAALFIAVIIRNPVYFIYLYFLSFALFLENNPGLQFTDLLFFIFTALFFGLYLLPTIITGQAIIETSIDKWYILFVIFIIFGFFNGLLYSHSRFHTISDMTYFIGVALFFPFKKHFNSETFQKVIFSILVLICFFVLIRNFLNYREIIISANVQWQIQKARVTTNEIILLTGAILALTGSAYTPKKIVKLLLFFIYALFIAGLILTQSRGYWVAFLIILFVIFFTSEKKVRHTVFWGNLLLSIIGFLTIYYFFNNIFDIVMNALAARWNTISSLASESQMGASLLERVYEAETILHKLFLNPITGYGMGVEYHRYYILTGDYIPMTYIHNGYLAIWFKTGIIGLISIIGFSIVVLHRLWMIYKRSEVKFLKMIALSSFGLLTGMLVVNVTSPQFFAFDSMTLIILISVFASHYSRHLYPKPA